MSEAIEKSESEKAAMRVAIAKDVIKQLDARKLVATSGRYCTLDSGWQIIEPSDAGKDLRDVITRKVDQCNVCAKGALFIAHVMQNIIDNGGTFKP